MKFKLIRLNITTDYPQGYGWDCPRTLSGKAEFSMGRYDDHEHELSEQALAAIAEVVMSDFTIPEKVSELDAVGGIVPASSLPALPDEVAAPPVPDANGDDLVF